MMFGLLKRFPRLIIIAIELPYTFALTILLTLAQVFGLFKQSVQEQLKGRGLTASQKQSLLANQSSDQRILCYCSSAGELEQAIPILRRLQLHGFEPWIALFSQSGFRYANVQRLDIPFFKAPYDFPFAWRRIFTLLRPQQTLLVRHEFWPAFLLTARSRKSRLILVNAVASPHLSRHSMARWLRRQFLACFDLIFAVGAEDTHFLQELVGPTTAIQTVGDSKYDRVFERQLERRAHVQSIQKYVDKWWPDPRRRRLIIGSAWPEEVSLLFQTIQSHGCFDDWYVLVAPHDLSTEMIERMQEHGRAYGLSMGLWSQFEGSLDESEAGIILVDKLGLLAELYSLVDMAIVGGALHHRVHNVLEPACQGVPIAFGPRHTTSPEAIWLVTQKLAAVVENAQDLQDWFDLNKGELAKENGSILRSRVKKLCGASEQIVDDMTSVPNSTIRV